MKLKIAFLLLLCAFFRASAQALKIGETLPKTVIDGINPADYNNKLLILDFWASSCSSCIESMPKLADLQKAYGENIKIFLIDYERPGNIVRFLAARPELSRLNLPIIAQDTALSRMFIHQYLPHVVWIYKGRYIQATDAEYVNKNSIDSLLSGKALAAEQKTDILNFDDHEPLFPVTANKQLFVVPLYTSALSGYIKGLPLSAGTVTDSTQHRKRYYVINHSIAHLYALALNSSLPLQPNRRVLPNEQDYAYTQKDGYYTPWQQKHCYSYEFTGPQATPDSLINNKMLSDLGQYLQLNGKIVNRKVACLLLQGKPVQSNSGRLIRQDTSGSYTQLQHITMDDLIYILNREAGMPPVIGQTNSTVSFDLIINTPPRTVADWQELLKTGGLHLEPAEKVIPMFILSTL